jgi:hypothetical protein
MRNVIKIADLGGVSYSGPQRPTAFSPPAMKLMVLRRYPLFRELPVEHIERLSTYASARAYARGATIFPRVILAPACSRSAPGPFGLRFRRPMAATQFSKSSARLHYLTGSHGQRTPPP